MYECAEIMSFEATWAGSDPIREMLSIRKLHANDSHPFLTFEKPDQAKLVREWCKHNKIIHVHELTRGEHSGNMARMYPDVDLGDWDVPF